MIGAEDQSYIKHRTKIPKSFFILIYNFKILILVYIAQERVTFFYSVLPAGNAPSTSKRIDFSSVWGSYVDGIEYKYGRIEKERMEL